MKSPKHPLILKGAGLWTPGYPGLLAFLADGPPDASVSVPRAALLPSTLRRRSSLLTRAGIEALSEAANAGGADPTTTATLWASAYGEIDNTLALLDMMRGDGMPSPTRFHNSVHNTASGTASIALGNTAFTSAIAAGSQTVQMGFAEAHAWLVTQGQGQQSAGSGSSDLLFVCLDEPPPAPFAPEPAWPLLAVAFHLSTAASSSSSSSSPSHSDQAQDRPVSPIGERLCLPRALDVSLADLDAPLPEAFARHPLLPALRLLAHLKT
ncbi:MAG: beta-ketoacyl synthase chain length factor [Myxococcales bacterium]|jgi:hypothetical protein|nr:beta-ketoacyl synthase chain length factor [Myxococcales bacterium]